VKSFSAVPGALEDTEMNALPTWFRPAAALIGAGAVALSPCTRAPAAQVPGTSETGESLVLAGIEPGQLMHRRLVRGSVTVRSTYSTDAPNRVGYVEGKDFAVDYAAGQVRRVPGSSIPDYSKNSLFGRKDFDHRNFPGFGNYKEFVFVDYRHRDPFSWPVQARQDRLLSRTKARLKQGQPLTIAAFGDSITAGGDATAPELIYWQRWIAALRKRYRKATITGVNSATGGDTTVQGLARLEQKVLSIKPDLVLVAFGMNDQNVGSVPLDRFEANLGEMVDRIRKETPAEIVLLSSCLPNPNWHYTSGRMPEYGRVTAKVAADKRCAFADVLTNWRAVVDRKKPEDLLSNNVNHPNDFGHSIYVHVLEKLGL
jgi:acyl-CoA thioesterase I